MAYRQAGRKALQMADVEGHTPLHFGAAGGCIEMVELLLTMGADPLAQSHHGATPVDIANAWGFKVMAYVIQQQAYMRLDYYNHELLDPNKDLSCHLQRRLIAPSLTYTSSYKPKSESPEANLKGDLTAISVRFSTPQKLYPQNRREEIQSPIGNQRQISPGRLTRNRRNASLPKQSISTELDHLKLIQTPASTLFSDVKNTCKSSPCSLSITSSIAAVRPIFKIPYTAPRASTAPGNVMLEQTPITKQLSEARRNSVESSPCSSLSPISSIIIATPTLEVSSSAAHPIVPHATFKHTIQTKDHSRTPSQPVQKSGVPHLQHGQTTEDKRFGIDSGVELFKSLQKLQKDPNTQKLGEYVNSLAVDNSVSGLRPKVPRCLACTSHVPSDTPPLKKCESRDIKNLRNSPQNSMLLVSAALKMPHVHLITDKQDVTSRRSSVDLEQQCLIAKLYVNSEGQGDEKMQSKQEQILTTERHSEYKQFSISATQKMSYVNLLAIKKNVASGRSLVKSEQQCQIEKPPSSAEGQTTSKQTQIFTKDTHFEYRRLTVSATQKTPHVNLLTDKKEVDLEEQHPMAKSSANTEGPGDMQTSTTDPHTASRAFDTSLSLAQQFTKPEAIKSLFCNRKHTASSTTLPLHQATIGEEAISTVTDPKSQHMKTQRDHEIQPSSKCRPSPSSQNGASYTPPLRIKQMKKAVSNSHYLTDTPCLCGFQSRRLVSIPDRTMHSDSLTRL